MIPALPVRIPRVYKPMHPKVKKNMSKNQLAIMTFLSIVLSRGPKLLGTVGSVSESLSLAAVVPKGHQLELTRRASSLLPVSPVSSTYPFDSASDESPFQPLSKRLSQESGVIFLGLISKESFSTKRVEYLLPHRSASGLTLRNSGLMTLLSECPS